MKKTLLTLAGLFLALIATAQLLPSKTIWQGSLGGLRILLTVTSDPVSGATYAILASPDQTDRSIPVE